MPSSTQALILPQHLTAIDCYDWTTHFKDCTVEYASQFKKAQFQSIHWAIVTWSNIRTIRSATSIEFYETLILPSLPQKEKDLYSQIRSSLSEKMEKDIKLDQIFSAMDRRKDLENYFREVSRPFSEEELERRRQQVANRPKLQLS